MELGASPKRAGPRPLIEDLESYYIAEENRLNTSGRVL